MLLYCRTADVDYAVVVDNLVCKGTWPRELPSNNEGDILYIYYAENDIQFNHILNNIARNNNMALYKSFWFFKEQL